MYNSPMNLREDRRYMIVPEIKGEDTVKELLLKNSTIATDGVFVLKDSISPDS